MIRLLIVDDSITAREMLQQIFHDQKDIEVVGIADSGFKALTLVAQLKPDIVTMDIHMQGMNGIEAISILMTTAPLPIIVVSGSSLEGESRSVFKALEAGALAWIQRPSHFDENFDKSVEELRELVRVLSEVKVVRRKKMPQTHAMKAHFHKLTQRAPVTDLSNIFKPKKRIFDIIVLGASTGGPQAIELFLQNLKKPFLLPIVIVQHMSEGFVGTFIEWLSDTTGFIIQLAQAGQRPEAGVVYVAPDCIQLGFAKTGVFTFEKCDRENGQIPSVSYLFRSAASVFGSRIIGVLLSGMGKDGAQELKTLYDVGAITFAQDQQSCVVFWYASRSN